MRFRPATTAGDPLGTLAKLPDHPRFSLVAGSIRRFERVVKFASGSGQAGLARS